MQYAPIQLLVVPRTSELLKDIKVQVPLDVIGKPYSGIVSCDYQLRVELCRPIYVGLAALHVWFGSGALSSGLREAAILAVAVQPLIQIAVACY